LWRAPSIENYDDGVDGAMSAIKANDRRTGENGHTVRLDPVDKDLSVHQITQELCAGSASQWGSVRQSLVELI